MKEKTEEKTKESLILAIDTSGNTASAALMNDYIVMAESSVTLTDLRGGGPSGRKTHSETLMPMIEHLFKITGLSLNKIDLIACTCGPGSFTGLRIGAATAKGIAFAINKPLIAVPTLDALAYTVDKNLPTGTWVVPLMDARRGQVYSAFYQDGKRVSDYLAEDVNDVMEILKAKTGSNKTVSSKVIFVRDGLTASSVGAVALGMPVADESEFSLMYIRKPQAEREKEEKEASK